MANIMPDVISIATRSWIPRAGSDIIRFTLITGSIRWEIRSLAACLGEESPRKTAGPRASQLLYHRGRTG